MQNLSHTAALALALVSALQPAHAQSPGATLPHGIVLEGTLPQHPPAQTTPSMTKTAKAPTVTIDYDAAGRESFQASAFLDLTNGAVNIPIPSGYRLILEELNFSGTWIDGSSHSQTLVATLPSTAAYGWQAYYFTSNPIAGLPNVVAADFPVRQYAETLTVALAYAGNSPPTAQYMEVTLSGHLIAIKAP